MTAMEVNDGGEAGFRGDAPGTNAGTTVVGSMAGSSSPCDKDRAGGLARNTAVEN